MATTKFSRSLRALLWLVMLPLAAAAQPQPINLTHHIGFDSIPTFARIQAAATSGAATLVVWGAADEANGATVGRLYYRLVRTNDSGRTRLLLDTSFRPANAVAIAPITAGFIVVWGDGRPDGSGVYAQRVTLDGTLEGAPTRMQASSTAMASIETLVTEAGITLVWSDSLGELFVHRFARDGTTLIDRASLGQRAPGNARRLAGLPDLIEIPTAAGVRIVDGANRILPLSSSLSVGFAGRHMVLRDSSVAVLHDSTIYLYRSLFSDEVLDSVTVSIPPSALALSALGVAGDSVVKVSYPVFTKSGLGWNSIRVEFLAWSWRRGTAPERSVVLTHDIVAGGSQTRDDLALRAATATRLCGNRTLITVDIRFSKWMSPGYLYRDQSYYFLAWPSGVVTIESMLAVPTDDCQYEDTTRQLPRIVRTTGAPRTSTVTALGDTFSAPTRRFRRGVDELEPNVIVDRGRVSVTFRSAWRGSTIGIIAWDAAGADSVHDAPPFAVKAGRSGKEVYRRIHGASILERAESWPGTQPGEPEHGSHAVMAVGTNWPMIFELGDSYSSGTLAMALGVSTDRLEVAGYYPLAMRSPVARSGPIQGPPRWTLDVEGGSAFSFVVHLDTSRMLLLHPRGRAGLFARVFGPSVAIADTFVVSDVDSVLAALPIDADRYFLISARDAGSTIVVREMRLKGQAISVKTVATPSTLRDRFFVLDPSDTSVAIVAVNDVGVHIARLGPGSGSTSEWTRLFEGAQLTKPSALFAGDTLYVAWADTANADADIVGIAIHRSELIELGFPQPPDAGTLASSSVRPTPSQESATLHIDVPDPGVVSLQLFDGRGRLVRTIARDAASAGWLEITIDVSDLHDGVYELRASTGGKEAFARISVVHDK